MESNWVDPHDKDYIDYEEFESQFTPATSCWVKCLTCNTSVEVPLDDAFKAPSSCARCNEVVCWACGTAGDTLNKKCYKPVDAEGPVGVIYSGCIGKFVTRAERRQKYELQWHFKHVHWHGEASEP